jgi:hypothetical protein
MSRKRTVCCRRSLLGILLLTSFVLFLNGLCWSQAEESGTIPEGSGGFEIVSQPPGATVHFSGEYDLVAITPFLVNHQLVGTYSVKATKPGYETYSRRLSFPSTSKGRLTIKLKSKTPLKAAWRSLFLPGWGQFYSGKRSRGLIISTLGYGAALTSIMAELRYQDREDEYEAALNDYRAAKSIEERSQLRFILEDKHQKAYDAETLKRNLLLVTAAVWAYNVLDALIFFPDQKVDLQVEEDFSLEEGELTVKLCKRF